MAKVEWTALAELDLEQIATFLAVDQMNPAAAESLLRAVDSKAILYAENPGIGIRVPELGEGARVFVHKRWAVIYVESTSGITIVGVFDATRDYPACQAKLSRGDCSED